MTSLEIIRSKQRLNKAVEDHAEAVKQKMEDEASAKFAPIKKLYDEVKNLPAKTFEAKKVSWDGKNTIKALWEDRASSWGISFRSPYSYSAVRWDLSISIEEGKFKLHNPYKNENRTTENVEEAKGWLVEKLATILEDEEAN
jgi:hypothetical protein